MTAASRLSATLFRRRRESVRRRRDGELKVESLEPRLALATGLLSTLVSVVQNDQGHGLLAPGATANINEGQQLAARVRLARRPDSPILVSFKSVAPLEVGVTETTLRFTRNNWNQPQAISLRSIQDNVVDGDSFVPVRMTTAIDVPANDLQAGARRPQSQATRNIWVESLDSRVAGPATPVTATYRGTVSGGGNGGHIAGSYDSVTNRGTVTLRATMPQLKNVRNRVITVGYSLGTDNRVQIESLSGITASRFRWDVTYRELGADRGLFGTVTVLQPRIGRSATAMMTAAAVPNAVQSLAVAPTGVGSLLLSWSPPAGGATGYTVTMNNGSTTTTSTTTSTSMPFTGLSTTVPSYAFTVTATNAAGSGPAAAVAFATPQDVASQPLALSATVGPGSGEAVLSWQPPTDDGGSPVVSYTVTLYQGAARQTVTTSATSATFSGLTTGDAPLLFRMRAITFAGNGLPVSLAAAADGTPLPLPPNNPFMGLDGTSTMHANASSSDATLFSGPGTTDLEVTPNFELNATMPSVLMSENGALVCVGVGTTVSTAQTPIVMLISPKTLKQLDQVKLIKPQTGNLAGGLYNYLDHQNRLVLVDGDGVMRWYSNDYDRATDAGSLTLEKSVDIGQPMVVGLVPDYEGRIWFATQGSLSTTASPAVVGYYDPQTGATQTYSLPAGEMVANSISSSPAGVAVTTTTGLALFAAGVNGGITPLWHAVYENSGVRKPGQLSPGTGSTPVFFGPTTGYEYLVITDNATAPGTNNVTPAENVNVYRVADGTLVAQTPFLTSSNAGTENAPIAVGNRIFVPSSFGYWYPPPSETGPATPASAPFAGGFQGMTLAADGTSVTTNWGPANTVHSSALPRLSLADSLIYTVLVNSTTQGSGPSTETTASYSFAALDPDTGAIVGTPLPLGSNTFSGTTPNYRDPSSYSWNTLQMTGVISPDGVFYQGTAAGLVMVWRNPS